MDGFQHIYSCRNGGKELKIYAKLTLDDKYHSIRINYDNSTKTGQVYFDDEPVETKVIGGWDKCVSAGYSLTGEQP